jgi:Lon protease-like protein
MAMPHPRGQPASIQRVQNPRQAAATVVRLGEHLQLRLRLDDVREADADQP